MRVVVTGQVGLDKKLFLDQAVQIARQRGWEPAVCNVGDMMYAEAPDVAPGKILDLPLSRLRDLRRSVFRDVLAAGRQSRDLVVNTHATFRWRHGLFYAFDYDQMKALDADLYVVLVDNIDRVHYRLLRDGHAEHTLKDLMVWREEEILATELLSQIVSGHGRFFILARGPDDQPPGGPVETFVRLIEQPKARKAYLSFPMSHVHDSPAVLAEIETFRREMKRHFICFDPGDVEEKDLAEAALRAAEQGRRTIDVGPPGRRCRMETAELIRIIPDIDGQIYARDFKLIDQSDMIISLVPELPDGRAGLSSGVERELQHAHEATRDVFVIWRSAAAPSPFVTETATRVFGSVAEAVRFFHDGGYVARGPGGTLFD
ncbi:MAG: AAA family ATPase [Planctomycetes bacterium]|nr:AAA family ATPase [Planctomycetota bacterium]